MTETTTDFDGSTTDAQNPVANSDADFPADQICLAELDSMYLCGGSGGDAERHAGQARHRAKVAGCTIRDFECFHAMRACDELM
jgi:hypothetical protein